jgi:Flp pilus assembly pilin Flp
MTNQYLLRFRRFLRDQCGQDMVEYALLAGFVAVSAGATLPGVAGSLGEIFSKVQSITDKAAGGGQRDGSKEPTERPNEGQA